MKAARLIAYAVALVAAGCGNNNSSTTAPTTTTAASTSISLFTTVLPVGGTVTSDPFSVSAAGTATLGLVSVATTPTGPALSTVRLGIGLTSTSTSTDSSGNSVTACGGLINSTTATPTLTGQLSVTVAVGTYCVTAFDPGTLTAPVTFAIRTVHP